MALSNNNMATQGLSGRVGMFVFRQRNGKTIVSPRPSISKIVSAAQKGIRNTFKMATAYAKAIMNNPVLLAFYNSKLKPGLTVFNLALADYCKAPEIGEIDTSAYNGTIGSSIKVAATDNGKVDTVKLKIALADGTLVEEGHATPFGDGIHYVFIASVTNASPPGSVISIEAIDMAGRKTEKSVSL